MGKTVIPFCTSESSSITQSVTEIRSVCGSANILDGFRAGGSETVPNLTMRVNCIGKVTSDLSVFKEMGDSVTMTFD